MKKLGIINQPISAVIAGLGHMDMLTIADAGLPIPGTTQRIDLALKKGIPPFLDTLEVVLSEMCIEKVILATEMRERSPQVYEAVKKMIGGVPMEEISHKAFKAMLPETKAVIRTGELTPFANVILVAGAWGFD
jgi:D-ribose pyranase